MPKAATAPTKSRITKPRQAAARPDTSRVEAAAPSAGAVARKTAKAAAAKPAAAKPSRAKAKPAAPATPVEKTIKLKTKLVRDSFTMPAADFALVDVLKERALGFRRPTKKSELLRAGLRVLMSLPGTQLETVLNSLEPLKPGRPKKEV